MHEGHAGPPVVLRRPQAGAWCLRDVTHLDKECHAHRSWGAVLIFGGSEQVSPETVHYLQSVLNNLERTLLERLTFAHEYCTRLKINKARSYSLITNKEEDIVHPPPRVTAVALTPSGTVESGLLMTDVSHAPGSWALAPWVVSRPPATATHKAGLQSSWSCGPPVWDQQGWGPQRLSVAST